MSFVFNVKITAEEGVLTDTKAPYQNFIIFRI